MLDDDLQPREIAHQRRQHALDEHLLAVEHVDVADRSLRRGRTAASRSSPSARAPDRCRGLVTPRAVGGRAGRVELRGDPGAVREPARRSRPDGVVGQIAGHQRREAGRRRRRGSARDRRGRLDGRDRRHQIRHDDRPRELPRGDGATARSIAPSRRWTCQSSGRRMVRVCDATVGSLTHTAWPRPPSQTAPSSASRARTCAASFRGSSPATYRRAPGLGGAPVSAGQMPVRLFGVERRRRPAARL